MLAIAIFHVKRLCDLVVLQTAKIMMFELPLMFTPISCPHLQELLQRSVHVTWFFCISWGKCGCVFDNYKRPKLWTFLIFWTIWSHLGVFRLLQLCFCCWGVAHVGVSSWCLCCHENQLNIITHHGSPFRPSEVLNGAKLAKLCEIMLLHLRAFHVARSAFFAYFVFLLAC